MKDFRAENLCHDPIHGYLPFVSDAGLQPGEVSERQLIDHPWLQRLRYIHQLQTAWWVFPSAEHTRFQHVLGAMHLGSRWAQQLDRSLRESFKDCPSPVYLDAVLRLAGLLHDVGHGPFGHFFDAHYLTQFDLNHETLGRIIIEERLGDLIRGIRRTPLGELAENETLDPQQIAWLICRPQPGTEDYHPHWLRALRSLLSGIYTIDNMDFVLRDAYMSGYSPRAFDLDRLLRYSFMTPRGLTLVDRGIEALIRFMGVRAELFRSIYFHRTVRAIDLLLEDLFRDSREYLFPGNPLDHLDEYLEFTEASLLVDVRRWHRSYQPALRELGGRWLALLNRQIEWQMTCQRTLVFGEQDREHASVFSDRDLVERRLRDLLPNDLRTLEFRVDLARHLHRPHTLGPAAGQNFLYDPAQDAVRPLSTHDLYERLPVSHRICRVYTRHGQHAREIALALDELLGRRALDDLTNM